MENEKKEKIKKIFRGIWLGVTTFVTFIFTICVVIGCSQQNKQSNAYNEYDVLETYNNEYQLKYDNHKNVVYNDNDYVLTFTYEELFYNDSSSDWENSVTYLYNITDSLSQSHFIVYESEEDYYTFIYAEYADLRNTYYYALNENDEYDLYVPNFDQTDYFIQVIDENGDMMTYSYLEWYLPQTYYNGLKNALIQDGRIVESPYSFDDEHYQIAISADYFNYEYRHLYEVLMANGDYLEEALFGTYMTYDSVQYNYADYSQDFTSFEDCVIYQKPTYRTYILLDDDYYFHYVYVQNDSLVYEDMDYSVVWKLNSSTYLLIKSAIAQDLEYGEYVSIFGELTDSTTGFIGVLNSGIQEVVNVFYYDNALTTIGILSVLVIAISLGYFLFRLLIGLIRMRG